MISVRRFVCCILILVMTCQAASAQLYDKLIKECYKMNSVFTDTGYQSFSVNYYFSTEKKPAAFTDSLTAALKVHRGNYYGKFRSEEYMQNGQYLVTVYTSNGSIMVSNPVKRNTSLVAVANLDSAFLASDIDSAWITESGQVRTIKFRFTAASSYKSYTIAYNKNSYQVQKIVYALKQQVVNPGDTAYMPPNPLITVKFSDYSKTAFSDNIYDHNRYITKDSTGQFKGTGNYSSYEVLSTYQVPDTSNGAGFLRRGPINKSPGQSRLFPFLQEKSAADAELAGNITKGKPGFLRYRNTTSLQAVSYLAKTNLVTRALAIKHLFNQHV